MKIPPARLLMPITDPTSIIIKDFIESRESLYYDFKIPFKFSSKAKFKDTIVLISFYSIWFWRITSLT